MSSNFFTRRDDEGRRSPIRQVLRASRRRPNSFRDDGGELNVKPAIGQPGRSDIQPLIDAFQGTEENPLGLDPRSGFGILQDIEVDHSRGFMTDLGANAPKVFQAGGETVAEAIEIARNLAGLVPGAGGLLGLTAKGVAGGDTQLEELLGAIGGGFGALGEFLLGPDEKEEAPAEEEAEVTEFQKTQEELRATAEGYVAAEALSKDARLTPEDRELAAAKRNELGQTLRVLENEIIRLQEEQSFQDTLFNSQERALFGDQGLLPGVSDEELENLQRSLDVSTGGVGLQPDVIAAIDAIANSNLSAAEQEDRIDFVLDQAGVRKTLGEAMQTVIQNRNDLEVLLSKGDADFLESLGSELDFETPSMRFDFRIDPAERMDMAIADSLEGYFNTQFGSDIPSEVLGPVMDLVGQIINMDQLQGVELTAEELALSPQIQNNLDFIASGVNGLNTEQLLQAIRDGIDQGRAHNEAWDTALQQESYAPGSTQLAMAIFKKGFSMGVDPARADKIAESTDLHHVISVKSGGDIGFVSESGTQYGIGALTPEAYQRLGYGLDEDGVPLVLGDPEGEIQALIDYVEEFGGPHEAMNYYLRTGDWGS